MDQHATASLSDFLRIDSRTPEVLSPPEKTGLPCPQRLRQISADLLDLAMQLEKGGLGTGTILPRCLETDGASTEGPPSSADNLDDLTLALLAQSIHKLRRRRAHGFQEELFAEPAWDMLLDLFHQSALGKRVSTTSLCIASAVPPTTALRWINILADRGIIYRVKVFNDGRLTQIRLSKAGYQKMRACLLDWYYALASGFPIAGR